MQTRKRAKSAVFGKKPKEKKEEPVKEVEEKKVISEPSETPAEKTTEKAGVVERRTIPEKPSSDELSETLPKVDKESEEETEESSEAETPESKITESSVETPASEFVTDTPLSTTPEAPKPVVDADAPPNAGESPLIASPSLTGEAPQPLESSPQPVSPSDQAATPPSSQELSPTPPPSAFTIQAGEAEAPVKIEKGGKGRFVIYFVVVALLAFILGLGAMAGASYLGFFKSAGLPKLPANIQIPQLGAKPTPTPLPPTAAPTSQPVTLDEFTIAVLNGSGISGKAADEKTALTTAGYKVASTGNADNSNYTTTKISAKKSVSQAFLSKLEDELKKSYDVDSTVATSPDSDQTDVTVTLGSQTAQ